MGESTLTGTEFGRLNTNEGTYNIAWVGSYTYTQNQKANTTTLTLYGSMYTDSSTNVRSSNSSDTFKVNGVTISPPTPSAYRYSSSQTYGYSVTRYYSLFGSTTLTVNHNANGTFPNTTVTLNAQSYHHNNLSGSYTISGLPSLDRTAPTVTISLSSRTTSSLTVAASTNVTCDRWEYSTDNGSTYTQFSTTSGTSASATISGLAANTTYKVRIRARRSANEVYGASSTGSYTTLDATAPVVTIALASRTTSSLTISATADAECNRWEYSTNDGSTYTQFSTTAGVSVSYTITGLSPNTTYKVKVRARKSVNSVTGTSATGSYTTLGAALLNSATEIYADAATVQVKINGTFYSSSYTYSLQIKRSSTVILTLSIAAQSAGTKDVTVTLSSAQRTTLLAGMSDVASFSATYSLLTYNNSTQIGSASTATATIKTSSSTSAPAQPTFSYADTNSATVAVTGDSSQLIAGQSTLRLTSLSATAKNGASIASYTITIGGATKTSTSGGTVDVGTVSQSGTLALKVVAKDTRGYTSDKSVNVTVYAYTAPSLTSYSVKRNATTSTQIDFSASGKFSNIGTNTVTLKYRYKKTSASSYGTEVTVTPTKSGGTFSYSATNIATFDDDSTYNFRIVVADGINSATYNLVVPTFTPLIAYRPEAVGFGAVPQGTKRVEIAPDWSIVNNGTYKAPNGKYYSQNYYAVDMNNSDIINANGIYMHDSANAKDEGIIFMRNDNGNWDTLYAYDGEAYIRRNWTASSSAPSGIRLLTTDDIRVYTYDGNNDQYFWNASITTRTNALLRRTGRTVMCYIRFVSPSTATSGQAIATIPTGYRPTIAIATSAIEAWIKNANAPVTITSGGAVAFVNTAFTTNATYIICATWITGDAYPS